MGVSLTSKTTSPRVPAYLVRASGSHFTDLLWTNEHFGTPEDQELRTFETYTREDGLYEAVSYYPGGGRSVLLRVTKEEGQVVRVALQQQEPEGQPVEVIAHRRLLAGKRDSWPDPMKLLLHPNHWLEFRVDLVAFQLLDEGELSKQDRAMREGIPSRFEREDFDA